MHLDVEDIVAGTVGSIFGRFVLFVAAVWLGCSCGVAAMIAGHMVEERAWRMELISWLWAGPLLLISTWALLNIPFLFYQLIRFIRGDGDDYLTWGLVAGVQSLVVMVAWVGDFVHGWLPQLVAWTVWLVISVMLGTGIWLIRQHFINCWARELGLLRAANGTKRAEKEAEERERMKQEDER